MTMERDRSRKVLLIGGTGVFGRRLAEHIVTYCADIVAELVVTSRLSESASSVADQLAFVSKGPAVHGIALDTRTTLANVLATERPSVVVDCSGPFQSSSYDVPKTAMEHRAHALDLADARSYLLNYGSALDGIEKQNGVVGVAGASSTPALSGAVVRELVLNWSHVRAIDLAIVPGGRSEVGRSVLEAVLSYAGRSVPVWRHGSLQHIAGWTEARTITVRGLGARRVATVETADAERLGARYDVSGDVTFSAGLESSAEQRGLEIIAFLRARKLLPDVTPLAGLLHYARKLTRWTTGDSGGMVVTARGIDNRGQSCVATWTLLAHEGSGPQVPILAAAATLRRLAKGCAEAGANLADDILTLQDILAEAQFYPITTHVERKVLALPSVETPVPA